MIVHETTGKLRILFAYLILPEQFATASDNAFTRIKFEKFVQQNVIQHFLTAPYYLGSNVQTETVI